MKFIIVTGSPTKGFRFFKNKDGELYDCYGDAAEDAKFRFRDVDWWIAEIENVPVQ